MDLSGLALLALAFFLFVAAIVLAWVGVRAAQWLSASTRLVQSIDREALPAIATTNAILGQASGQMEKVDRILDTAVGGVEAADKTVRRVAAVLEKPLSLMGQASAFVAGSSSSYRARRAERRAADG